MDSTPIWAAGEPVPDWCFVRHTFELDQREAVRATVLITAASTLPSLQYVYRAHLNGTVIGVGPTRSIGVETRYDTYDVTGLITPGRNAIGALLYTRDDHRFQAELRITLADGATITVGTGPDWQARTGNDCFPEAGSIGTQCFAAPVENLDARHYPHGFDSPDFADPWPAAVARTPFRWLVASPLAPVERHLAAPAAVLVDDADGMVIDFGRAWAGGALIRATAAAGDRIELRFGEILDPEAGDRPAVKYELTTGNVFRDVWTLTEGEQELATWGMRVFRYLEVRYLHGTPDLTEIKAAALRYRFDGDAASFASSDPVLDRVWQLSADTIEALNVNLYVDSWTRERLPYEADAYLQQRAHLSLDRGPALARYSVDFTLANRTWPTEWPLFGLLAVHDLWWTTGNLHQVREQYHRLPDLLPTRWLDPATGLVRKPSDGGAAGDMDRGGFDRDLVDWPPSERDGYRFGEVNTVINALSYRCYRAAADLARALGEQSDADFYEGMADRLGGAIEQFLVDPDTGHYADGLEPDGSRIDHHAIHAQLYPLWAGAVPAARIDAAIADLGRRGMACSVYSAAFLVEGLFEHGAGDLALPLITAPGRRSWRHMLDVGAGAAMEAWDVEFKPNLSHSHPWGASPAYLLPQGLFGLRPLEPGYRSFTFRPQPAGPERASVRLPIPGGAISASYARTGDRVDLRLDVPPGTTAQLALPARAGGSDEVELDRRMIRLRASGRWLIADEPLLGGEHRIAVNLR